MTDEPGPDEISIDEARWIIVVLPELGADARSVAHYAKPIDEEFRRTGLGYVFKFGSYKNRTEWSIDVEVRERDVEQGIETARRVLRSLDAPASTSIRYEDLEQPVFDG